MNFVGLHFTYKLCMSVYSHTPTHTVNTSMLDELIHTSTDFYFLLPKYEQMF